MRSPTSACFVLTLLIMLSKMRVPGATLTLPGAGSVRCFNPSDDWADVEPEGKDGFCGGAIGSWARIDVATKHEQKRPFNMRNFLSSSLMPFEQSRQSPDLAIFVLASVCWDRTVLTSFLAFLSTVLIGSLGSSPMLIHLHCSGTVPTEALWTSKQ